MHSYLNIEAAASFDNVRGAICILMLENDVAPQKNYKDKRSQTNVKTIFHETYFKRVNPFQLIVGLILTKETLPGIILQVGNLRS